MSKSQGVVADLRCSFCGKSSEPVKRLIRAGNSSVAICNECVETCNDIMADNFDRPSSSDEQEPDDQPDLFPFKCPGCGHQWKVGIGKHSLPPG